MVAMIICVRRDGAGARLSGLSSHWAVAFDGPNGHAQPMGTSSLGDKALTLSALVAVLTVVGWVKWTWLKRWWHAVNYP